MNETFRVLALDGVSPKGLEILTRDTRFSVEVKPPLKEAELIAAIGEFDAVIVRSQTKVTAMAIAAGRRLKVIGRAGVGVDNVDVEAATERGIIVMNTPAGNTISTAEHAFSMMLALARFIPQAHQSMREGQWDRKSFQGTEVCNKVLGIIGMGRIGSEVARRAIAFGMRVVAFDPYLAISRAKSLQVELVDDLNELLTQADFITLHMPLTEETRYILNADNLKRCRKGVRIINCARGGLINEKALAEALQTGQVGGAALDVYEEEPPAKDFALRAMPSVVLTPHLGASTAEAQESVGIEIAEAISEFLTAGSIRNAVNMPNVDARTLAIIRPYLLLADKLGKLACQLASARVESLVVSYHGPVSAVDTAPITRAVLKGFLHKSHGAEVNEVNAPRLAASLGLRYSESRSSQPEEFTEMITVQVACGEEKHEVAATLFGARPKIVRIDGYSLEATPEGVLMLLENHDTPGIIGFIGTLLGRHKVNIANMSLSRNEIGQKALSVYNLDSAPDEGTLTEIRAREGIFGVKIVKL
jgi:D-3-phosphoglycerate dehydrogenase